MSTPATTISLPSSSAAHAVALGMLAGRRYRPNYVLSSDGTTLTIQMVQMPQTGCIDYDASGNPVVIPPPLTDPTAFDAAGTAATAVAAETTARAAAIAVLTAGSPDALNTFLEAYNRFLTDESAASAMNAAISSEATARAAADASEAAARAAAVTAITPSKAAATVDFGYAGGNGEGDYATTTVSAAWVTSSSRIVCCCAPSDSADHTTDETIAEGITFDAVNVVPGVSFDVKAFAPQGTWGRHNCVILGL